MTKNEKKEILTKWEATMVVSKNKINKIADDLNINPEFSLFQISYELMDSYTETVSLLVGDKLDWLNWYIYESSPGHRTITIGASCSKSGKEENHEINKASDFVEYDIF